MIAIANGNTVVGKLIFHLLFLQTWKTAKRYNEENLWRFFEGFKDLPIRGI